MKHPQIIIFEFNRLRKACRWETHRHVRSILLYSNSTSRGIKGNGISTRINSNIVHAFSTEPVLVGNLAAAAVCDLEGNLILCPVNGLILGEGDCPARSSCKQYSRHWHPQPNRHCHRYRQHSTQVLPQ